MSKPPTHTVLWRVDSIGKTQSQGKQLKASELTLEEGVGGLKDGDVKPGVAGTPIIFQHLSKIRYLEGQHLESSWSTLKRRQLTFTCIPLHRARDGKIKSKYAFYCMVDAYIDSNN